MNESLDLRRTDMSRPHLILASGSKARAQMLTQAGVSFDIDIAQIDEQSVKISMVQSEFAPRDIADALAEAKAAKVSRRNPGALVLGSDQVLVLDGQIFDKPNTLNEARGQIEKLSGQTHRLISAAVMMIDGVVSFRHIQIAKLAMRSFTPEFIDHYFQSEGDAILDCVGSYRLEGLGAQLFSTIEGDYFTILGLPMLACLEHFRDQGILVR